MERRAFVSLASTGALAAAAAVTARDAAAVGAKSERKVAWQMATSWSDSPLDTLFAGARTVCDTVAALTGGRFVITPYRAGDPALPGLPGGVMPGVIDGSVPIGHTAAYFYTSLGPFLAFATGVPFGLTARQQNAWLYAGGGLQLLQQLYADRFGLIQFPAGNTGAQMGGWFRYEVSTLAQLQGLKMRIAGFGAEVLRRLGVVPVSLGGGQILAALQDGTVDAAEFVGPFDDERLQLHTAAPYYYYPGWWEAGATLEVQVNRRAYDALPLEYQQALRVAAYAANLEMLAAYDARNHAALQRLQAGGTQLRAFSSEILDAAHARSHEVLGEFAAASADFAAVYQPWSAFRSGVQAWHGTNELSYMNHVSA